ncbi:hypothetical protein DIPPA_24063 [Diplonema papillatum]|nr:hypothetical protein DIPPA_24063 [Diplonema papillatum]
MAPVFMHGLPPVTAEYYAAQLRAARAEGGEDPGFCGAYREASQGWCAAARNGKGGGGGGGGGPAAFRGWDRSYRAVVRAATDGRLAAPAAALQGGAGGDSDFVQATGELLRRFEEATRRCCVSLGPQQPPPPDAGVLVRACRPGAAGAAYAAVYAYQKLQLALLRVPCPSLSVPICSLLRSGSTFYLAVALLDVPLDTDGVSREITSSDFDAGGLGAQVRVLQDGLQFVSPSLGGGANPEDVVGSDGVLLRSDGGYHVMQWGGVDTGGFCDLVKVEGRLGGGDGLWPALDAAVVASFDVIAGDLRGHPLEGDDAAEFPAANRFLRVLFKDLAPAANIAPPSPRSPASPSVCDEQGAASIWLVLADACASSGIASVAPAADDGLAADADRPAEGAAEREKLAAALRHAVSHNAVQFVESLCAALGARLTGGTVRATPGAYHILSSLDLCPKLPTLPTATLSLPGPGCRSHPVLVCRDAEFHATSFQTHIEALNLSIKAAALHRRNWLETIRCLTAVFKACAHCKPYHATATPDEKYDHDFFNETDQHPAFANFLVAAIEGVSPLDAVDVLGVGDLMDLSTQLPKLLLGVVVPGEIQGVLGAAYCAAAHDFAPVARGWLLARGAAPPTEAWFAFWTEFEYLHFSTALAYLLTQTDPSTAHRACSTSAALLSEAAREYLDYLPRASASAHDTSPCDDHALQPVSPVSVSEAAVMYLDAAVERFDGALRDLSDMVPLIFEDEEEAYPGELEAAAELRQAATDTARAKNNLAYGAIRHARQLEAASRDPGRATGSPRARKKLLERRHPLFMAAAFVVAHEPRAAASFRRAADLLRHLLPSANAPSASPSAARKRSLAESDLTSTPDHPIPTSIRAEGLINLAFAYIGLGRWGTAEEAFEAALQLKHEQPAGAEASWEEETAANLAALRVKLGQAAVMIQKRARVLKARRIAEERARLKNPRRFHANNLRSCIAALNLSIKMAASNRESWLETVPRLSAVFKACAHCKPYHAAGTPDESCGYDLGFFKEADQHPAFAQFLVSAIEGVSPLEPVDVLGVGDLMDLSTQLPKLLLGVVAPGDMQGALGAAYCAAAHDFAPVARGWFLARGAASLTEALFAFWTEFEYLHFSTALAYLLTQTDPSTAHRACSTSAALLSDAAREYLDFLPQASASTYPGVNWGDPALQPVSPVSVSEAAVMYFDAAVERFDGALWDITDMFSLSAGSVAGGSSTLGEPELHRAVTDAARAKNNLAHGAIEHARQLEAASRDPCRGGAAPAGSPRARKKLLERRHPFFAAGAFIVAHEPRAFTSFRRAADLLRHLLPATTGDPPARKLSLPSLDQSIMYEPPVPTSIRAEGLINLAFAHIGLGRWGVAEEALEAALELRGAGDGWEAAAAAHLAALRVKFGQAAVMIQKRARVLKARRAAARAQRERRAGGAELAVSHSALAQERYAAGMLQRVGASYAERKALARAAAQQRAARAIQRNARVWLAKEKVDRIHAARKPSRGASSAAESVFAAFLLGNVSRAHRDRVALAAARTAARAEAKALVARTAALLQRHVRGASAREAAASLHARRGAAARAAAAATIQRAYAAAAARRVCTRLRQRLPPAHLSEAAARRGEREYGLARLQGWFRCVRARRVVGGRRANVVAVQRVARGWSERRRLSKRRAKRKEIEGAERHLRWFVAREADERARFVQVEREGRATASALWFEWAAAVRGRTVHCPALLLGQARGRFEVEAEQRRGRRDVEKFELACFATARSAHASRAASLPGESLPPLARRHASLDSGWIPQADGTADASITQAADAARPGSSRSLMCFVGGLDDSIVISPAASSLDGAPAARRGRALADAAAPGTPPPFLCFLAGDNGEIVVSPTHSPELGPAATLAPVLQPEAWTVDCVTGEATFSDPPPTDPPMLLPRPLEPGALGRGEQGSQLEGVVERERCRRAVLEEEGRRREEDGFAVKIQACWRGARVRAAVDVPAAAAALWRALRERCAWEDEQAAAGVVQRNARVFTARRRAASRRRHLLREPPLLQRVGRGLFSRARVHSFFQQATDTATLLLRQRHDLARETQARLRRWIAAEKVQQFRRAVQRRRALIQTERTRHDIARRYAGRAAFALAPRPELGRRRKAPRRTTSHPHRRAPHRRYRRNQPIDPPSRLAVSLMRRSIAAARNAAVLKQRSTLSGDCAARRIQRFYRATAAPAKASEARRRAEAAGATIRAAARGWLDRAWLLRFGASSEYHAAAKIQAAVRGWRERRAHASRAARAGLLRVYLRRSRAAVLIQSGTRGRAARRRSAHAARVARETREARLAGAAGEVLGAWARGALARRRLARQKLAVRRVQIAFRSFRRRVGFLLRAARGAAPARRRSARGAGGARDARSPAGGRRGPTPPAPTLGIYTLRTAPPREGAAGEVLGAEAKGARGAGGARYARSPAGGRRGRRGPTPPAPRDLHPADCELLADEPPPSEGAAGEVLGAWGC